MTRRIVNIAKQLLPVALLGALAAGCISSPAKVPSNWTLDWERSNFPAVAVGDAASRTVRVASVAVRAPYDTQRLAVLRADGSLAFDPYNTFASPPAQLLRGAVHDALGASGRFKRVLGGNSGAAADFSAEVTVTTLALDCRKSDQRDAVVALTLSFVEGREVVYSSRGKGSAATENGDFSAAFSRAFALAMQEAMREEH